MPESPDRAAEPLWRRALAAGTAVALAGAAILVTANTLNVLLLDNEVAQFAASEERTAFTWAASSAAFAAAFVAALHLVAAEDARLYAATAAVLAFLSLDDAIQIHERLGDRVARALDPPAIVENRVWMFLYAPLLAAAFALLWLVMRRMAEPVRRYARVGVALLLVGVVLEGAGIATNELAEEGSATPHRLRAGVEEAAELSGWVLVAAALTASLVRRLGGDQWQRPEPASVNDPGAAGTKRQS